MNRRAMLKMSSVGVALALGSVEAETRHEAVGRWEVFEVTLAGPSGGDAFANEVGAVFSLGHRTVVVDGFYDGDGRYKVRFMPDAVGEWTYATMGVVAGQTGRFACVAAREGVHGPVGVRNTHHFAYADGTAYFPFGTTCYAWIHQSEGLQEETLETLGTAPFNKIRMCLFPKSYEYNHNEPELYPFERTGAGASDFSRPNPAFYAHLERRILDLQGLGIEVDLILFHPYDRWGYSSMPAAMDDRYLRYTVARLAAFRNVWWSMANEWDFMKAKSLGDFDRFFHLVEQRDPVGHLRSIHHGAVMYDHAQPWVTHASVQSTDFEAAAGWLKAWKKPVIYDEVMYEGNLNRRWGNLSGEEQVRRFWLGVIAGCYVTHGETLLDSAGALDENVTTTLWWAHGGKLRGTSPARIAFLRKIVEETAVMARPGSKQTGITAGTTYYLNALSVDATAKNVQVVLYYMDFHQPLFYEFPLPEGSFDAEMIDPWAMTVTKTSGRFYGKIKLRLTGKPFCVVRFRRAT